MLKSLDLSVLDSLKGDFRIDLPLLNKFYLPEKNLSMPDVFTNGYSRDNKKLQRILKKNIRGKENILEIGCGAGDFTIPLVNKFPDKKFIVSEPTSSIFYAKLKVDLHNMANSKKEYFQFLEKYIPLDFRENDKGNHPLFFNKIQNIEFIPGDSFEIRDDLHHRGIEIDFAYAAFVANNYYAGAQYDGGLQRFISSVNHCVKEGGKIVVLDGDFEPRSLSWMTKQSLCNTFNLKCKKLHKNYFAWVG